MMQNRILFKHLINNHNQEAFKKIIHSQKNVQIGLQLIRYAKKLDEEVNVFRKKIEHLKDRIEAKEEESIKELQEVLEQETTCEKIPQEWLGNVELKAEEIAAVYHFIKEPE